VELEPEQLVLVILSGMVIIMIVIILCFSDDVEPVQYHTIERHSAHLVSIKQTLESLMCGARALPEEKREEEKFW
jgi:hypothetical protein